MTVEAKIDPPFRAEHVGSLLRPKRLTEAFHAFSDGHITRGEFEEIQDDCIRAVVMMQQDVGLKSITDGEFRRASYWSHFVEAVDGFTVKTAAFDFHDADGNKQNFLAPYVEITQE